MTLPSFLEGRLVDQQSSRTCITTRRPAPYGFGTARSVDYGMVIPLQLEHSKPPNGRAAIGGWPPRASALSVGARIPGLINWAGDGRRALMVPGEFVATDKPGFEQYGA